MRLVKKWWDTMNKATYDANTVVMVDEVRGKQLLADGTATGPTATGPILVMLADWADEQGTMHRAGSVVAFDQTVATDLITRGMARIRTREDSA